MKVFETIYMLLLAGFFFGIPVAATSRPAGQEFSWGLALKQSATVALILAGLFALNFFVADVVSKRFTRR